MATRSWIVRTGQLWKLGLFYSIILLTLALIVTFIFAVNDYMVSDFAGRFELAVTFVFIGFLSLFWLCLSIVARDVARGQCGECSGQSMLALGLSSSMP